MLVEWWMVFVITIVFHWRYYIVIGFSVFRYERMGCVFSLEHGHIRRSVCKGSCMDEFSLWFNYVVL